MAKVVVTEFMDEGAVAQLRAAVETLYDPTLVDHADKLSAEVAGCRALIVRNRTQVRGALLDGASSLAVVGRLGVGLDNIDVEACKARGIEVIPATGANATAVAEYVIGSLFILIRGAFGATDEVLDGGWPRPALSKGGELAGRTLGLVGFGTIARETGHRARALGMTVLAHDPMVAEDAPIWSMTGVQRADLHQLMAASDAVSLHVPLTDETRGLIDAAAIAGMKPGAVLVNSARGGIVDEAALAAALRSGQLGGAALDVFADEPLPAGSALNGAPNLLLTPHIAGVTQESNRRVSTMIAGAVLRALGHAP